MPSAARRRPSGWFADASLMTVAWALPIGATVLVTPYLIDRVGPTEYGLFGTVVGLAISVAAIGLSRPLLVSLAAGRTTDVDRAVRWGILSALAGGALVALAAVVVPGSWLAETGVSIGHARDAIAVGGFAVLGTALMSTLSGVASGQGRFRRLTVVTAGVGTITSAGYWLLALAGHGAVAFVVWLGAASLLGALVFLPGLRRSAVPTGDGPTADGRAIEGSPSPATAPLPLVPFVVAQVAGNVALVVERSVLAVTTGFVAVTEFVIPQMLVLSLHGALVWMTTPLVLRATKRHAAGDRPGLVVLYRRASRMTATVAAIGGVSLAVVGRPLMSAWLGGEAVIAEGPFLLLVLYATMLPMVIVAWAFAEATGHAGLNARLGVVLLLGVVAGAALTPWWGVAASAAGRAFLVAPLPFFLLSVERRVLGGATAWGRAWTGRLVVATVVAGLVEAGLWVGLGRSWLAGFTAVAVGVIAFLVVVGPRQVLALVVPDRVVGTPAAVGEEP